MATSNTCSTNSLKQQRPFFVLTHRVVVLRVNNAVKQIKDELMCYFSSHFN